MQPQQVPQPTPPPIMPNSGSDPYHFIMSPGQTPKRSMLKVPNGSSLKGRILIVVGGAVAIIIILSIVVNVFSSSGQAGTKELIDIATRQQELIRVAQLGYDTTKTEDTKNLALTAQLGLTSDQQQLLALLKKSNLKVGSHQLNSRKNSQVDALFTQANQTNQFDQTFTKTLQSELANYQVALKKTYDANSGKKTRALLTAEFNDSQALLGTTTAAK